MGRVTVTSTATNSDTWLLVFTNNNTTVWNFFPYSFPYLDVWVVLKMNNRLISM